MDKWEELSSLLDDGIARLAEAVRSGDDHAISRALADLSDDIEVVGEETGTPEQRARPLRALRAVRAVRPAPAPPTVALLNHSALIDDKQAALLAVALQTQVDRDFAPIWGPRATVDFVPAGATPPPGCWWLAILEDADQAGALGYHELTDEGLPVGKVFARTTVQDGGSISVVASHELLESLADPNVNLLADVSGSHGTLVYAFENCFTGDTKVSLLSGEETAIADLVGRDEFWVYSCDENGHLRPGRGHSARLARRDAPIVAVTLDSGEVIRCTADHRFMLRDGSYAEAGSLAPGASMMPLYRRRETMPGTKIDYEQCYESSRSEWVFTHRFVEGRCPKGYVRHHVDFDRFNNAPPNLSLMTWDDHRKLHADHVVAATRAAQERMVREGTHPFQRPHSAEHREKSRQGRIAYNRSDKHRAEAGVIGRSVLSRLWEDPEFREKKAAAGAEHLRRYNASDAQAEALSAFYASPAGQAEKERSAARCRELAKSPKRLAAVAAYRESDAGKVKIKELSEAGRTRMKSAEFAEKKRAYAESEEGRRKSSELGKKNMHQRWHVARGIVKDDCELCQVNNHKVVSVEAVGTADVYDLSVDRYHNFALSAGVFVHNCDAVEADEFGYEINGIRVSDFVTPEWFNPAAPAGSAFDFTGHVSGPLQLLPGGYIGVWTPDGWTQKTADGGAHHSATHKYIGNRWHRRVAGRAGRRRSTPRVAT